MLAKRKILSLITLVIGVNGGSVRGEHLRWDDPNEPGVVKSFGVYATGPLPSATLRKATVTTNLIDLAALLGDAPSGRYSLCVISNARNGLSSERSEALVISWAGSSVPSQISDRLSACAKLAYSHAGNGVAYQTFQDRAHVYAATAYLAISTGKVCKVELNLRKVRQPTGEITVYVWSNYKGRPAALLAVSSSKIDASAISDGWYAAQIEFRQSLGETYWIGLAKPATDPSNNVLWNGGGPGARCYSADGLSWVFSSNQAMNIRVYE